MSDHTDGWDTPSKSSVGEVLMPCGMCGGPARLITGNPARDGYGGRRGWEGVECGGGCGDSVGLGTCHGYEWDTPAHEAWSVGRVGAIVATLPHLAPDDLDAIADALVAARAAL